MLLPLLALLGCAGADREEPSRVDSGAADEPGLGGGGALGVDGGGADPEEPSRIDSGAADEPGLGGGALGVDGGGALGVDGGGGGANPDVGDNEGGGGGIIELSECGVSRAPIRRLTKFEYNNSVRDLFGDDANPANALPADTPSASHGALENHFGNDATALSVSDLLVEQYLNVAEDVGENATATPEKLATLRACAANVTETTEEACAREIIQDTAPKVYRRPLETGEADDLLALFNVARVNGTFNEAIAALIEGMLQSPDFLYRVEHGLPDSATPGLVRPSPYEMATRLSFLLWGTTPDADAELMAAAAAGGLQTAESVLAHATRMLNSRKRSRVMFRYFFDRYLPIRALSALERDDAFPSFSGAIGALMREETQTFLEHEIYEGSGTWAGALNANYTFVNEQLAGFYGFTGVTGEGFQQMKYPDTTKRLGLLTHAGMLAGPLASGESNPVARGITVVKGLMCSSIALPPPGPVLDAALEEIVSDAPTARERFSAHSEAPACAGCHAQIDPPGFALENYDPVGLWRDQENGATIDASGNLPGVGEFAGPTELAQKLAMSEQVHSCFARNWSNYAYGLSMGETDNEKCTNQDLIAEFTASGFNIKQLMLSLTQSDSFLYLPANRE